MCFTQAEVSYFEWLDVFKYFFTVNINNEK